MEAGVYMHVQLCLEVCVHAWETCLLHMCVCIHGGSCVYVHAAVSVGMCTCMGDKIQVMPPCAISWKKQILAKISGIGRLSSTLQYLIWVGGT